MQSNTERKAMFSHIMLGATDIEASKKFYDEVLGVLGYGPGVLNAKPYRQKALFLHGADRNFFDFRAHR